MIVAYYNSVMGWSVIVAEFLAVPWVGSDCGSLPSSIMGWSVIVADFLAVPLVGL